MSFPKELLSQMNLKDLSPEDMKQAESIWKMLDNMADSNPEEYKKFIDKNVKDGMSEMKKNAEKEIENQKITPSKGQLFKCMANLKQVELKKEEETEMRGLLINQKKPTKIFTPDKSNREVKIYLNVCYSSKIIKPLDKNNKQLQSLSDIKQWCTIPFSLHGPTHRMTSCQQKYDS